CMQAIEFPLTF
nr:immunoglobulin light chain junction region [Macaca mulatta]MOW65039.1 immunoglobulin light chain junction region [Macaca mulatta]